MPLFGEYETVGEAHAESHARDYDATVWRARKTGGSEGPPRYALKCISPRRHRIGGEGVGGEQLAPDRRLEWVAVFKQIKQAQMQEGRGLAPIHAFGTAPEGAWYVTDLYQRFSLKALVTRQGQVDHAALRHVVYSVVAGCLALKHACARTHGNLKLSNVLLGGRVQPLKKTPLLLADPRPAPANPAAGADAPTLFEAQDLKVLGELILQLVEGRIIESGYDYNYPIAPSAAWERLGREAANWRTLCNQLLDPHLSLDRINLSSLARQFKPKNTGRNLLLFGGVLLGAGVVAGGLYEFSHRAPTGGRNPGTTTEAPAPKPPATETLVAERPATNTPAPSPPAVDTKQLAQPSQERDYQAALKAGRGALQGQNFDEAISQATTALRIRPQDADATGLLNQAQAGKDQAATDAEYSAALEKGRTALQGRQYDEVVRQANLALKIRPLDADATALLAQAQAGKDQATGDANYATAMTSGRTALRGRQYDEAIRQATAALGLRPKDEAATALLAQAQAGKGQVATDANYATAMASGRTALQGRQYDEAISQANVALAIRPQDADATALLTQAQAGKGQAATDAEYSAALEKGRTALQGRQYDEVVRRANLALKIRPLDADATALLAQAQAGKGQVATDANYATAMASGRTALQGRQYDEAISQANAALGFRPKDEAATALLAQAQAGKGQAAADANYTTAMASGRTALQGRQYDEAIRQATAALGLRPQDADATTLLTQARAGKDQAVADANYTTAMASGRTALQGRQYDEAISQATAALGLRPKDGAATALLAQAQAGKGQAAADANYTNVMTSGRAALQGRQYDEAISQATTALGLRLKDEAATALLAQAQAGKGQAAADANYATAMASGRAALQGQKYDEAISQAKLATGYKPNDAAAADLLSQAEKLQQQALDETNFKAAMQAAQAKYDGQDYPNAMSEIKQALLIKATDATALDLEKRVQDQLAGLGVLTAAQEQFNSGDYAFTNGPDFLARTNQPAFGSLLSQAGAEAAQLAQLTGLVQTKDRAGVNAGLATLSPGALKKPPFATIVKWREDNNPVNLRDAELHQLNAVFTRHVDKSFARAANWPDLESGKARFLGLPITVDAIEDMNYKTNYLGRLESLRANFDRLGALDDSRKKNLQALKKVIDDWLPPNN